MITVRYPNGQAIQYNEANYLSHKSGETWVLRESSDGEFIAFIQASAGVIVEFVRPCRVSNPLMESESKLNALAKEIRSLKRKIDGGRGKRKTEK